MRSMGRRAGVGLVAFLWLCGAAASQAGQSGGRGGGSRTMLAGTLKQLDAVQFRLTLTQSVAGQSAERTVSLDPNVQVQDGAATVALEALKPGELISLAAFERGGQLTVYTIYRGAGLFGQVKAVEVAQSALAVTVESGALAKDSEQVFKLDAQTLILAGRRGGGGNLTLADLKPGASVTIVYVQSGASLLARLIRLRGQAGGGRRAGDGAPAAEHSDDGGK